MIVDAHVHLREAARPGAARVGASELLRAMDDGGVDAAVVLPCPGLASNEFVQQECARHPDRLVSLYLPDFGRPAELLADAARCFDEHQPRGVKIHPRFQGVRPADAVVQELAAWAQERRVPVLFDVFPHGPTLDDAGLHPTAYAALARRCPDCTIVLAHAGGYRALEAFMVAKAHPNVLLDSSFTLSYLRGTSAAQDLAFSIGHLFPGRTLYGSDFPEIGLGEHLELTRAALSGLEQARARAFYGDAAAAVYRIPA